MDNVDFSVSMGAVVPSHVHVATLPDTIVQIYPQWRGDDYFVVRDEIVIVDHSRKVVAVVPAGSSARASAGSSTTVVNLSPAEIREVQTVLIQKGYLHGRADGEWGPRTREALIAFQRKEGVETTGRIDPRTVRALGLSDRIQSGAADTGSTESNANMNSATSGQSSPQSTSGMGGQNRGTSGNSTRTQGTSNPSSPSMNSGTSGAGTGSRSGTSGSGSNSTSASPSSASPSSTSPSGSSSSSSSPKKNYNDKNNNK